jgi:hypothetical protein
VLLDGLVRELGRGEQAHGLERQVAQVGLAVTQELAQLIARADQKIRLTEKKLLNKPHHKQYIYINARHPTPHPNLIFGSLKKY